MDPGPLRLEGQWYRTAEWADCSGEVRSSGIESLREGNERSSPSGIREREPFLFLAPSIRAATAAGDGEGGGGALVDSVFAALS